MFVVECASYQKNDSKKKRKRKWYKEYQTVLQDTETPFEFVMDCLISAELVPVCMISPTMIFYLTTQIHKQSTHIT